MVVEQDGGQRRGIDTEYLVLRHLRHQLGVQRMDTLYHEDLVVVQTKAASAHLALTQLEVVTWKLYLLAVEQGVHLLVEQVEVQCVEVLEVIVAIGLARRVFAIDEIVVERDGNGLDAVRGQLYGQALTGCRLTAAGRSGDEHHADALSESNVLGNFGNFLLLQGLADLNELRGVALLYALVQVANGSQANDVLPLMVLLEDGEHLVLMGHLAQLVGMLGGRQTQQKTVEILLQSEEVELRRVDKHRAIVIVQVAVNIIIGGIETAGALQQLHLREGMQVCEHLDGILRQHLMTMDGQCGIDDGLHLSTNLAYILERHGVTNVEIDIIAVGDGDIDGHLGTLIEIVDGFT